MTNVIMVTGGTGTLGQAITKNLINLGTVDKIVIYSRDEASQVRMGADLEFKSPKLVFHNGSVTNRDALYRAIDRYSVTHVIHAAALKHVPICEKQPSECIDTNVLGSRNVLQVSAELGVKRVVLVSTDKAATPGNVYGLSKALMEKLMYEYNGIRSLTVNVVRFGNLVGSRGSVLELFIKQIKSSGSVTVTNPEMTRFFIRIKQAATTTLYALMCKHSGQILVPQMKSAVLKDFVNAIFEFLGTKPEMQIIGPRPGEKLHEGIISEDEVLRTGTEEEFFGYAIHQKIIPESKRSLKAALSSKTAPKMKTDELVGMIREIGPKLSNEALSI